jgi:hypothetical protein
MIQNVAVARRFVDAFIANTLVAHRLHAEIVVMSKHRRVLQ